MQEPMSWRADSPPATPGHKAIALHRARLRVEHVVHSINLAKTSESKGAFDFNDLYEQLAIASRALVFAQEAWDLHKASRADAEPSA